MIDTSKRYELVHKEALRAREMTEAQAVGIMGATALLCALLVGAMTENLGAAWWIVLVAFPVVFIGLVLLLAHRLGIAYAIIRTLDAESPK